jgi:hypothetical protein
VLDSQPSQAMSSSSFDYYADESKYHPFEADTIGLGDTGFMDVDVDMQENSASTARPSSPPPSLHLTPTPTPARPVSSAALDQLQDYSSRLDESSRMDESSVLSIMDHNGSAHASATVHHNTPQVPSQASHHTRTPSESSKRRAEVNGKFCSF